MIISKKRVNFFDPQKKIWPGKTLKQPSLRKAQESSEYAVLLKTLDKIAKFSASKEMKEYPHTLFRFPLRCSTSSDETYLSEDKPTMSDIEALMETFTSEAETLLLFLRSVESIKISTIHEKDRQEMVFLRSVKSIKISTIPEKDRQEIVFSPKFSTEIAEKSLSSLRKEREQFQTELASSNPLTPVRSTAAISVKVTNKGDEEKSDWLVSNWVDCQSDDLKDIAKKISSVPWVGVALRTDGVEIKKGRVFCTVPLPVEVTTALPVHVNGTFSLDDNRRSLKWPGEESRNSLDSQWNKLLVDRVVPPCYALLLREALVRIT